MFKCIILLIINHFPSSGRLCFTYSKKKSVTSSSNSRCGFKIGKGKKLWNQHISEILFKKNVLLLISTLCNGKRKKMPPSNYVEFQKTHSSTACGLIQHSTTVAFVTFSHALPSQR